MAWLWEYENAEAHGTRCITPWCFKALVENMVDLKEFREWYDKYGWIHLNKNPAYDESENHPMFHSIVIVLYLDLYEHGLLDWDNKLITEYLSAFDSLYFKDIDEWKLYPEQKDPDFSLDNFTGIIAALLMIRRLRNGTTHAVMADRLLNEIPLFHKQLDHPRDFCYVVMMKFPITKLLILPLLIVWGAHIVTMIQEYKTRGGVRIPKTDGKILAYLRSRSMPYSVGLPWKLIKYLFFKSSGLAKIHTEIPPADMIDLIKTNDKGTYWSWKSFWVIFHYYFKNIRHPVRKLVKIYQAHEK